MTIDELIAAAAKCGPWRVRRSGRLWRGLREGDGEGRILNQLGRCPMQAVAVARDQSPYTPKFSFTAQLGLVEADVTTIATTADGDTGSPWYSPALRARLLRELVGVGA